MSVAATQSQADPPSPTSAHEKLVERALDRDEPTRTKTLRGKYQQRLRGRWQAIMAALREGLVERDALGLQAEALVDPPRQFEFDTTTPAEQFEQWVARQTRQEILEEFGGQNQFIRRAYQRGIDDARGELRALGIAGQSEAAATAMQLPVHRDQLEQLYNRNFQLLDDMSEAAAQDMRETLTEGLAAGDGPRDIARNIADRVHAVGITRANAIGRTEIIHSHNAGRAREWERAGIKKVDILLAATACPICQSLKAGAPYSIEDAAGLIPGSTHPNCRCALTVYTVSS